MFIKSVVIICFICTTVLGTPIGERIVNGTDALPGEIPYIVSIRFLNGHNCGGSLVSPLFVLTAAHCVKLYPATFLTVQCGVTTISSAANAPNVVKVSKIIVHKDYNPENGYSNDIALIKLASEVPFSNLVQPVKLPPAFDTTPADSSAVLAGWGIPYTGGTVMYNLQRVDISVYSDDECEKIFANIGPTNRKFHLCAGVPEGGKGQCSGDSGGPLTVNGVLTGIVSWSVKPCTVKGYPGVFCKVSNYVDWILDTISNN